jgi:Zn-finger nucleic acid-binding protein
MKCPNCNETLIMADRQGIEIDYCPKCRGVWLDRGELDKIIERSADYTKPGESNTYDERKSFPEQGKYQDPKYHDPKYNDPKYNDPYYRKKKKGFLGDFFDFD